ncbi:hypothetical protein K1719_036939 [Acacia pycnantha]|nr:hypothetical protein K1719_036939 [Acacia pycnantha]
MAPEKHNSKLTFPQFDVVSDMSDHHFLSSDPLRSGRGRFLKAISKEWRILKENLPESIFCRVPEKRSDLLRAAIIGAAGTPYHDALFFFDIALTPNYPNEPPKVHYLSHGHRVNPNLYGNGTVCLSLLNTYQGNPSEHWNPKQSTLLQIEANLVSEFQQIEARVPQGGESLVVIRTNKPKGVFRRMIKNMRCFGIEEEK